MKTSRIAILVAIGILTVSIDSPRLHAARHHPQPQLLDGFMHPIP